MSADLESFLQARTPFATSRATWGSGIRLHISWYLSADPPPAEYISSVRAVVLHQAQVLLCRDPDGTHHLLPGGRCEEGESPLQTLHREVLEETGWTLATPTPIAFLHFHHLTPRPPDYAYPYPHFLQQVYAARARARQEAPIEDEWVEEAFFAPLADLDPYSIAAPEHRLLQEARAVLAAG